jgi:hypothetical protein
MESVIYSPLQNEHSNPRNRAQLVTKGDITHLTKLEGYCPFLDT